MLRSILTGQFKRGEIRVSPSLGRALIKEPLGRFLEQQDYQLEPGGESLKQQGNLSRLNRGL